MNIIATGTKDITSVSEMVVGVASNEPVVTVKYSTLPVSYIQGTITTSDTNFQVVDESYSKIEGYSY